jgi:tetratricopeptide (TPR) repeat protein
MDRLLPSRLSQKSLAAFIAERYEGNYAAFLTSLSDHMNQIMRSDLRGARLFAHRVEALTAFLSGTNRGMALRVAARYYHLSGRTTKSLGLYRLAALMYKSAGDDVSTARIGRAMVDALMYDGRYSEAVQTGRAAAGVFKRRGLDMDLAQTLCNIGNVYHRQDHNQPALKAYDEALAIIRPTQNGPALALVQFNRGNILTNLHRLNEAEQCYVESRAHYVAAEMELAAAQAEYSLAYLLFLRGRITEALGAFERVLGTFERLGDHRGCAQTHLDMLEIRLQLNLFNAVEVGAREVIARFRTLGMRYEQAKCWYFLAKARAALEDLSGARTAVRSARSLLREERNGVWDGSVQLLESRLLLLASKFKESRKLATTAMRQFDRAGDVRRRTSAILALADIDIQDGQLLRSQKRLAPIRKKLSKYPISTAFDVHWLQARIQRLRGDTGRAIASYERALDAAERIVEGLPPDETRVFFLTDKLAMYHELTAMLLHQRDYGNALRVLERSRQLRRSSYRRATVPASGAVPEALLEKQEALRSRLHRLYGFPSSLERFSAVDVGVVRKTEDELWTLVQRSRQYLTGSQPRPRVNDPLATDVPIEAGCRVVIFASEGDYPGAVILGGSRVTYRRLPVTWEQLETLIGQFYFFIEKTRIPGAYRAQNERDIIRGTQSQLGALSEAVLWPLLADLSESEAVTFVPLDSLGAIPFHALSLPNGVPLYLTQTVRNVVDMTTALNAWSAGLTSEAYGEIFSPGTESTREMDAEAAEIRALFPKSRHQMRGDSSRGNFRTALAGAADFLHVASHASAAIDNPMFSEVLLNDGPFYAFDLFDQPVNPQLVTLAACQTGRPGVLHAGQTYGLAEAFIGQGARAVLSSLWTVDDRLTRAFMVDFYRSIRNGNGIYQAWTQSMDHLRETNGSPYEWAPFVLIGMTS